MIKHGLDGLFALLALVLLAPLLVVLAVAVRSSGRPVLARERRLGKEDRQFDLYRFRCALVQPPGPRRIGGPTLTRTGRALRRTGLEDLPQILNLLKGDLSLVGPRPQRAEVLTLLDGGRGLRARMRPGLTGPAQLGALRGPASPDARRDADDSYVRSWSLWLDAKVLARTFVAAFRV